MLLVDENDAGMLRCYSATTAKLSRSGMASGLTVLHRLIPKFGGTLRLHSRHLRNASPGLIDQKSAASKVSNEWG